VRCAHPGQMALNMGRAGKADTSQATLLHLGHAGAKSGDLGSNGGEDGAEIRPGISAADTGQGGAAHAEEQDFEMAPADLDADGEGAVGVEEKRRGWLAATTAQHLAAQHKFAGL